MFGHTKQMGRWIAIAAAIGVVCSSAAPAKNPNKPPTPADPPSYMLVDLLGFPDNGYQSQGEFITNRNADGNVLIGGNSRLYLENHAVFHPALWHVDIDGFFPETDPVDLGEPPCGGGVEPRGMNSLGVMVADTRKAVEKDEAGNWVFPSYVIVPGLPFVELPGPFNRNANVQGINDAGEIVGTYEDLSDPDDPDSLTAYGGIWQFNPDGTISGPICLGTFYPWDINNCGVMAGYSQGWPAIARFEGPALIVEHLDTSPEFWGADVNALNDCAIDDPRLTVVGLSFRDETGDYEAPNRGYVWRPVEGGNPTILGTLGGRDSVALGVNTQGDVVGWSDTKRQGQQAFLFKDGTMSNLNAMADVGNKTLRFALDINDDGDIVGFMGIPRPVSEQRGFLLRPIPEQPSE